MTPEPTPEQLERARRIAADGYYPLRHTDDHIYARDRILCGDMDSTVQVQTALTAILESDQRYAELLAHAEAMAGALDLVIAAMLNGGDGKTGDFGWNITKLTKARPTIREATTAFREFQEGKRNA